MLKKITAQTVGLDLVSVQPMSGPTGSETEKERIERENYNKRVALYNKLNKIKGGNYKPIEKKYPSGLLFIDYKYNTL